MGLPIQNYFPFTDTGKKQWRRDHGPILAWEVKHNGKSVLVAARDGNDAKVLALPIIQKAWAETTDCEKVAMAQYLELRVTRRPDLDQEATSRGEIIV